MADQQLDRYIRTDIRILHLIQEEQRVWWEVRRQVSWAEMSEEEEREHRSDTVWIQALEPMRLEEPVMEESLGESTPKWIVTIGGILLGGCLLGGCFERMRRRLTSATSTASTRSVGTQTPTTYTAVSGSAHPRFKVLSEHSHGTFA